MKLRLLITPKCNRNCPECCNLNFDLGALPQVDRPDEYKEYTEISLTGGEPLLDYDLVRDTIMDIREYGDFKGPINLYTAMPEHPDLPKLAKIVNLTVSVHDKQALVDVVDLWNWSPPDSGTTKHRIKLSPAVHRYFWIVEEIISGEDDWSVEKFDWIDDCPLPEGEVFKRL